MINVSLLVVMNVSTLFLFLIIVSGCVFTGYAYPARPSPQQESARDLVEIRHRRQADSQNCTNDLLKAGEDPFLTCFHDVKAVYPNSRDYTQKTIGRFCNNSCPEVMRKLYDDLARDCSPSPDPDKALLDVIEGACHIDPSGNYCGDVYNTGFNDTMEKIYQDCVTDTNDGLDCSDSCKEIVDYILSDLGCCYTDLANFLKLDENYGDKVITSKVFEACGTTEPDLCKNAK